MSVLSGCLRAIPAVRLLEHVPSCFWLFYTCACTSYVLVCAFKSCFFFADAMQREPRRVASARSAMKLVRHGRVL